MRSLSIIIPAMVAVAVAWVGVSAVTAAMTRPFGQVDSWQLVETYKGDAFILDHGMTQSDCFEALPYSDAAKGLSFQCVREG